MENVAIRSDTIDLRVDDIPVADISVTEWQEVEFTCIPPAGCSLTLKVGHPVQNVTLQPFLFPGDPAWHWRWNPHNMVGTCRLTLSICWPEGQIEHQSFTFEVSPRKIDRRQYLLLLDDLQRTLVSLLTMLPHNLVGGSLRLPHLNEGKEHQRHLIEDYYRFFQEHFARLEQAVMRIARHPHTHTRTTTEQCDINQAYTLARLDRDMTQGSWISSDKGILPARISQPCTRFNTDTYENQLLKQFLGKLWRRACDITNLATSIASSRSGAAERNWEDIALQSSAIARRLYELRSLPFLANVGHLKTFHGASHLIRRNPDYRHIYRSWQALRHLPEINVAYPQFYIPIDELPRLYEYWCVVQVLRVLLDLPGRVVQEQCLFPHNQQNVEQPRHCGNLSDDQEPSPPWSLVQNQPLMELEWRGWSITLRYQPRYQPLEIAHPADSLRQEADRAEPSPQHTTPPQIGSLDCHTHIPDIAVELWQTGAAPLLLLLDAKYRLTSNGNLPEDALADAYTYLGSIGIRSGQQITRRVVLLYPGTQEAEHYASGISIAPLVPGKRAVFQNWFKNLLSML
jgi:large subunit ribosomal protein MRP49